MCRYVAMWSGPRSISTAMMRAWSNRPDTVVCDEPLYAHYLLATRHTDHPGYAAIIDGHETDWKKVIQWLLGPIPNGKNIFYQKQMAHHLVADMSFDWIHKLSNCFLIREPGEMLLSLIEFLPSPSLEETGLPQQLRLFEDVRARRGGPPPVIDATDVLKDPRGMLRALCVHLQLPFYDEMLCWPLGPRETDGVWARYWYQNTYNSTSFLPYQMKNGTLPERLEPLLQKCRAIYDKLYQHRLRPLAGQPAVPDRDALIARP